MSSIFSSECCEHKQGPSGTQIGPLAFNHLHTSFYTPMYIEPTIPITTTLQYHYPHEKSCLKQLEFSVFESYLPTQ